MQDTLTPPFVSRQAPRIPPLPKGAVEGGEGRMVCHCGMPAGEIKVPLGLDTCWDTRLSLQTPVRDQRSTVKVNLFLGRCCLTGSHLAAHSQLERARKPQQGGREKRTPVGGRGECCPAQLLLWANVSLISTRAFNREVKNATCPRIGCSRLGPRVTASAQHSMPSALPFTTLGSGLPWQPQISRRAL